jgi:hypothetical protein
LQARPASKNSFPAIRESRDADEVKIMNRRGIEFTVMLVEPGLWQWRFKIGEKVTTGNTKANLMGLATRRVQQRIDIALKQAVRPGGRPDSASSPDTPESHAVAAKRALSV